MSDHDPDYPGNGNGNRNGPTDRGFSHPDFGREARVEVKGSEVRLIFVGHSHIAAVEFAENIVEQLKAGALNITLMGLPTSVTEEE